jgi:hypothetical protein
MTPAETEKGRDIQGYTRNFKSWTFRCIPVLNRSELQLLLHNSFRCFPATDILMLVTAAHVGKTTLFKRFKCHLCCIMETGKKITRLVRKALPAFEPKRLGTQFERSAMDKEHSAVNPIHRHIIEDGQKGGIPQLLMTIGACCITPADKEPMEIGMVVVPEDRYEPVLPGQGMDLLESLLRPVTPVEEVSQIDEHINRPEGFPEMMGLDTSCKCTDCN